jgi:hypothetical protein
MLRQLAALPKFHTTTIVPPEQKPMSTFSGRPFLLISGPAKWISSLMQPITIPTLTF